MKNDKKLTVVSLDLATKTGWAILKSDGTVISGVADFKTKRIESGDMRYKHFKDWMEDIKDIAGGKIDVLYFEEVRRHIGNTAGHVYGGFVATLMIWCGENEVSYSSVPVGTIKKHATGKGNASKVDVINAMVELGYAPKDDNEADALALLHCVQSQ